MKRIVEKIYYGQTNKALIEVCAATPSDLYWAVFFNINKVVAECMDEIRDEIATYRFDVKVR